MIIGQDRPFKRIHSFRSIVDLQFHSAFPRSHGLLYLVSLMEEVRLGRAKLGLAMKG
jgi:hypothetical protein